MPFMPFAPAGLALPSMAPPFYPFSATAAPVIQRLFPATNGPASPTATSGGWTMGMLFSVTGAVRWLNGYWTWACAGAAAGDLTARKFALWQQFSTGASQQLVTGSVVTSGALSNTPGTGEVGGHWNFTPLITPIQLAPGTLYVACQGWTVASGIPLVSGQFDSGQTYQSGIVNGFLTGWSAATGLNTYPAGTANNGLGQMLFQNTGGGDPSIAAGFPNNGSGSDNFFLDVSVSDTAPAGYSGSWRLYPNKVDAGTGNWSLDTANGFTLGLQAVAGRTVTSNNIWFYSPATVTQLPTAVGVFRTSDNALVLSNLAPSWLLPGGGAAAAGQGWMKASCAGSLPAGTYRPAVFQGANVIWNMAMALWWSTGFGGGGLVAGPLSAPNTGGASPGQESYNTATGAITAPNTNIGPFHYGVDWEVT